MHALLAAIEPTPLKIQREASEVQNFLRSLFWLAHEFGAFQSD